MEQIKMVLCDTNIFIEIYKDNNNIIEIVKNIGQQNIAISDVTCAELLFGARNKQEIKAIRNDIDSLIVLPIEYNISRLAVELVGKYSLSHKLSLPDALIAATALCHGIELYTLNKKDFKFIEKVALFEKN
jgi:tRNA(fMet)-specific endonuclease VapC